MRVLLLMMLVGCGMDVKVRDSEHNVNVRNSEQKIVVESTLDKILEICGIVKPDGSVVPYSKWTAEQTECVALLDKGNLYEPN